MASKTTNYLLGFISGTVTGITFGFLAFLSKREKTKEVKTKVKNKNKKKKKEE